ncbi:hypothetical protein CCACVL1_16937 [Corchorus capsularis]|uniref:Pentatricopeptide repeat-containing protein n=1 Tax=Corchorus capsularis TaxID=210143 RepID=A0A1R3HUS1_COCAP|nr:hypothetical protein CCACVL1_16937 [Corchorus capsularis]
MSSIPSPADASLADKAIISLMRHPYLLNSLASDFTPEAASCLLLKSQNDQELILRFLNWARPHPFFTPHCKCMALHILTRFKLYKSAQSLAENLAFNMPEDEMGNFVFQCLKETYHLCASSSSVFDLVGLINEADRAFESMLQRNFKPDEAVYNIMIHGHCRGGNIQKAYNLYKEMVNSGFVPHTMTVIALVKELFMDGETDKLSQVIANTLRSSKLTDAELAKVLVEINHKEGNMDAVLNVLTEMAKDGLLPNSG